MCKPIVAQEVLKTNWKATPSNGEGAERGNKEGAGLVSLCRRAAMHLRLGVKGGRRRQGSLRRKVGQLHKQPQRQWAGRDSKLWAGM